MQGLLQRIGATTDEFDALEKRMGLQVRAFKNCNKWTTIHTDY